MEVIQKLEGFSEDTNIGVVISELERAGFKDKDGLDYSPLLQDVLNIDMVAENITFAVKSLKSIYDLQARITGNERVYKD